MRRTLSTIAARFKKYAIFLLILPILTGVLAFFATDEGDGSPSGRSSYFAKVTIDLGEFNDPQFNEANNVKNLISSTAFLQKLPDNQSNTLMEIEDIQLSLDIENVYDEQVIIKLIGSEEERTLATLEGIVDHFIERSDARYDEWTGLINQSIEDLEETEVAAEEAATRQELLFNLRENLFFTKQAEVIEPVTLVTEGGGRSDGQPANPFTNVIFGLIIGFMLSLFLVLLPEVFRD
ncbi:hypothetical protein FZC78_22735 [Rossellomorea vietnamensis]|uniref:Uncharacterized protein n=1 Tax=Rossellomorea vietnamensis TaxID=218284 RepID=A0A5D4NIU3_9BACI|nr:hypothetical protein [Rossellomorea vietnamensis]TYS12932.1 hypothetical protein FZC78_22735 [Rossellomorea vietnamensis]